jgi:hypothetical protein
VAGKAGVGGGEDGGVRGKLHSNRLRAAGLKVEGTRATI